MAPLDKKQLMSKRQRAEKRAGVPKRAGAIISKKVEGAVPKKIQDRIHLLSMNKANSVLFGSYGYSAQLYSVDIDTLENVIYQGNREDATAFFVDALQNIIRDLQKAEDLKIGDIKSGLDERFMIDVGKLDYDIKPKPTVYDYHPQKVRAQAAALFRKGLLTRPEYEELTLLIKDTLDFNEYQTLYDYLREFWIVRWTPKQVLDGLRPLRGKRGNSKILTLSTAINQPTMTKVDTFSWNYGKFLEITNMWFFYYTDIEGRKRIMNQENDLSHLDNELRKAIQKLVYTTNHRNYFKATKRMWSVARMRNDKYMLKKLTPFLSSDNGRISQLIGDLKVLMEMMKGPDPIPMEKIADELQMLKEKAVSHIYHIPIRADYSYKIIDDITSDTSETPVNVSKYIASLTELINYFTDILNANSKKWLRDNGLYPVPNAYLPDNDPLKYKNDHTENFVKEISEAKSRTIPLDVQEYTQGRKSKGGVKFVSGVATPTQAQMRGKADHFVSGVATPTQAQMRGKRPKFTTMPIKGPPIRAAGKRPGSSKTIKVASKQPKIKSKPVISPERADFIQKILAQYK